MVALCHRHANVIVQWAGDDFAGDAEDEGAERDQAGFSDTEVVWWCSEERTVDDREYAGIHVSIVMPR